MNMYMYTCMATSGPRGVPQTDIRCKSRRGASDLAAESLMTLSRNTIGRASHGHLPTFGVMQTVNIVNSMPLPPSQLRRLAKTDWHCRGHAVCRAVFGLGFSVGMKCRLSEALLRASTPAFGNILECFRAHAMAMSTSNQVSLGLSFTKVLKPIEGVDSMPELRTRQRPREIRCRESNEYEPSQAASDHDRRS